MFTTARKTLLECSTPTGGGSQPACDFGAPSYSPDDSAVVVSRSAPGASARLEVVRSGGGDAVVLTPQIADDTEPAFLPSGGSLVFTGSRGGVRNLYTASLTGTGLRQLTTAGAEQPAPCADGTIAYVHRGHLYLLSRNRRLVRRLTTRTAYSPDCAPNARQIVFAAGDGYLYEVPLTGGPSRRIAKGVEPRFAPDGHQIAFVRGRNDPQSNGDEVDLWIRDMRTGHGREVAQLAFDDFSGDAGTGDLGSTAGLSWQPR